MDWRFWLSENTQNKREKGFPSPEMLRTNVLEVLTGGNGSKQMGGRFWVSRWAPNKRDGFFCVCENIPK